MGSEASLYLGSLYLGSDRKEINPLVMTLFRESDKRTRRLTAREASDYRYPDDEDDDPITLIEYACSAGVARDRLELMGFTLDVARRGFELSRTEELERYKEYSSREGGDIFDEPFEVLKTLTPEKWSDALREIRTRKLDGVLNF